MNVNYSRGLSKNKPQSNLDQCGADVILHMTRVLLGISSLSAFSYFPQCNICKKHRLNLELIFFPRVQGSRKVVGSIVFFFFLIYLLHYSVLMPPNWTFLSKCVDSSGLLTEARLGDTRTNLSWFLGFQPATLPASCLLADVRPDRLPSFPEACPVGCWAARLPSCPLDCLPGFLSWVSAGANPAILSRK